MPALRSDERSTLTFANIARACAGAYLSPQARVCFREVIGAGDGIRTRDQELGKLLLYQLSYARLLGGSLVFSERYKRVEH